MMVMFYEDRGYRRLPSVGSPVAYDESCALAMRSYTDLKLLSGIFAQQVGDGLIVKLGARRRDRELRLGLALVDGVERSLDATGQEPVVWVGGDGSRCRRPVAARCRVCRPAQSRPDDRVRLPGARLPKRKHSHAVAVQSCLDKLLHAARLKQIHLVTQPTPC